MATRVRILGLSLPLVAALLGGPLVAAAGDAELALAKKARASVVRIRWRDSRYSRNTSVRNAVVVRADGMLVMAGAPLPASGTLTARFADGRELPAERVGSDTETALTLLRVRAANLPALELRQEPAPRPARAKPPRTKDAKAAKDGSAAKKATAAAKDGAKTPAEKGSGDLGRNRPAPPRPLRYAPVGLRVVMVTSDGAIALGPIRSHRRHGTLYDPATRRPVRTTGLLGAALAAVDEDAGAPFLDARGRIVGLLVGRKGVVAPEKGEEAARLGLRLRPEPREAVAVPADVIRLVWPLLERHRRVPRAGLGVRSLEMDDVLRAQLDLDTGGHVLRGITPGSAAARKGLELHDIIVRVDGRRIEPGTSLHDVLLPYRPGMPVKLGVYRAGDRVSVALRLEERR